MNDQVRSRIVRNVAAVAGGGGALVVATQLCFGRLRIPLVPALDVGAKTQPIPAGVLINGMIIGSLYGLLAVGLILIYRGNRIINFAQGALGSSPAVLALLLLSQRYISYPVALLVAVAGSALLGAGVEAGMVRRFRRSPRLILTVATIGIAQLLTFVEVSLPRWVIHRTIPANLIYPTPFRRFTFTIGIVRFSGDHVFTVIVVAATLSALGLFLQRSRLGIAIRASAENADRAALLGVPVDRVGTAVWAVAAVVSALAVFLRAPLLGASVSGLISPAVLLYGLAAAVIARMEKMSIAVVAGVGIGVIDQGAIFGTRRAVVVQAVMLGVILAALLVQRRAFTRTGHSGGSSWQEAKEHRPLPLELRGLPEVRALRLACFGLGAALALLAPFIFRVDPHGGSVPTLVVIYAMVGVSLVILTGWTGQISLGQFAVAGIGAAVAGGMATKLHGDFFVCLVVAGIVGACVAVVVGLPALRIPGLLLAVATLAFSFTVYNLVLNREYFGWLLPDQLDFVERPILWGRYDMASSIRFYYLCLFFLGVALAVGASLRRNRSGRVFIGVRANERMMQSYGVNVARTRLAAFAISGFIAAVAGALLAFDQGSVDAGTFTPQRSIDVFVMVVIGGVTSLPGAAIGAIYMFGLPQLPWLRSIDSISLLATGAGLFVLLLFLPGGFTELGFRVRDRYLRWVANRRGIVVPSLVADRAPAVDVLLAPLADFAPAADA